MLTIRHKMCSSSFTYRGIVTTGDSNCAFVNLSSMCLQVERSKNKVMLVKEALSKLSKQQYSIEELTRKPPPEGVDPLRLEDYLSDQDFKVGQSAAVQYDQRT